MPRPSDTEQRRARLTEICLALPEAAVTGQQHLGFTVRRRTFAYYLDDHHGDGRVGLNCKAAAGELDALVAADPERFYRPQYLASKGWIGLRLDLPEVDWVEVAELVAESYTLVAPKRLAGRVHRG